MVSNSCAQVIFPPQLGLQGMLPGPALKLHECVFVCRVGILEIEPRALHMLGKSSTMSYIPSSTNVSFKCVYV
jgi:hypothetical protein